jgi:hypothetical protein
VTGFNVAFNDDWTSREWPATGVAGNDKVSDKVKSFFKSMKCLNEERRAQLGKVYSQALRAIIHEFCMQCTKQPKPLSGVSAAFQTQADAAAETFTFDLRKEPALHDLICAVVDLDEMLPANFLKSHFHAL